jgi:triacylglycerol lipase
MARLRGIKDLVIEAIAGGNRVTQESHRLVSEQVFSALGLLKPLRPLTERVRQTESLVSGAVYAAIRGSTKMVGAGLDLAFDAAEIVVPPLPPQLSQPRSDAAPSPAWAMDAALGALNGVVGDFLVESDNDLAIEMRLQTAEEPVDLDAERLKQVFAEASPRVCILVHGLAATPWSFSYGAEEHYGDPSCTYATMLERDLDYTCVYLHYNSGLSIRNNGLQFARMIEGFVAAYPVAIEEICLLGHSMGGLVVRSACEAALQQGMSWPKSLRHVICLGSPHQGAPLEKLGHLAEEVLRFFPAPTPHVLARVLGRRSQGIQDLRHGDIADEPAQSEADEAAWLASFEKLSHVQYCFLAASITADPKHPVGHAIGDMLVRIPSALASEADAVGGADDCRVKRMVVAGVSHLELANNPRVYAELSSFLAAD